MNNQKEYTRMKNKILFFLKHSPGVLLEEITPLLLLLAGTITFGIIATIGIAYNLIVSVGMIFQARCYRGLWHFVVYWAKLLYQVWCALSYVFLHVAIGEDLIANAAGGKAVERVVTDDRETLFGHGRVTISAAIGYEEVKGKLNKDGKYISWLLTKVLGMQHSIRAYLHELKSSI